MFAHNALPIVVEQIISKPIRLDVLEMYFLGANGSSEGE